MSGSGGRLYLGSGALGPLWAPPEHAALILGPPRSGKTSAVVVPTVLAASGPVVSTSTKPDVLLLTAPERLRKGPCWLFDPSGTVVAPDGVVPVRWSPVRACTRWDDALLVANALVGTTRPGSDLTGPAALDHWSERAQALLAPLLHAAAAAGDDMAAVLSWVDRRQPASALRTLDAAGATVAGDLLAGIAATDQREQSGIWSTASGVLAAYRSEAALATTRDADFDADEFCRSASTLYVCSTGRHQALAAPLVVGLLTEVRSAVYAMDPATRVPTVFALDEVANIAPIPDLPSMVSEGGGQGVLTLACLQDLSQARVRWGQAADGFLSLFGTTMVMAGIGDLRTLEALNALGGEHEVPTVSVTRSAGSGTSRLRSALAAGSYVVGGRLSGSAGIATPAPSITVSTRMQPRLPVDVLARGRPGMAVTVDERNRIGWVELTPWFTHEPWRSMVQGHAADKVTERDLGRLPPASGIDLGR